MMRDEIEKKNIKKNQTQKKFKRIRTRLDTITK